MDKIKGQLYAHCKQYVQERINAAQQGIDEARASSANETKSSAGDKYETGRAMAQQEIDRNTIALTEAKLLLNNLERINPAHTSKMATTGCLVRTDKANFYLAIGAGAFEVGSEKYFAVSPTSPIGLKLAGKSAGDKFEMNGVKYAISEVC